MISDLKIMIPISILLTSIMSFREGMPLIQSHAAKSEWDEIWK